MNPASTGPPRASSASRTASSIEPRLRSSHHTRIAPSDLVMVQIRCVEVIPVMRALSSIEVSVDEEGPSRLVFTPGNDTRKQIGQRWPVEPYSALTAVRGKGQTKGQDRLEQHLYSTAWFRLRLSPIAPPVSPVPTDAESQWFQPGHGRPCVLSVAIAVPT